MSAYIVFQSNLFCGERTVMHNLISEREEELLHSFQVKIFNFKAFIGLLKNYKEIMASIKQENFCKLLLVE